MAYSDKVIDHFENPRNMGTLDKKDPSVGTGIVGAPECGDVMRLQIKVSDGVIEDAKFKTFGCGSAIASSSLATPSGSRAAPSTRRWRSRTPTSWRSWPCRR
jgi:nitrogen fixation NifU-like protein